MAESDSAKEPRVANDGVRPSRTGHPAVDAGRRPRVAGDEAAMPQVQLALGLLIVFLFLLVLWMVWPVLSHS